jgi:uncharacterized protein YjaZ
MKIQIVVTAFLLFAAQPSSSIEHRAAPSTEVIPEKTATLQITFDDREGGQFSDADKLLIRKIVAEAEKKVRMLLPTLPVVIEVTVVIINRNIDVVGGVTGRANAPGMVLLELSNVFPGGVSAAARTGLASSVFHEFHHLDRGWTIQGNKYGPGIPIAAVNEGLASVFAEEFSGIYFEEAYGYPDDVHQWLEEVLALPADADYNTWMNMHPDGRTAIGYRLGRYIVHQATAISGMNVIELSKVDPDEILEMVTGAAP